MANDKRPRPGLLHATLYRGKIRESVLLTNKKPGNIIHIKAALKPALIVPVWQNAYKSSF
jgi:hypothetical protein